MSVIALIFSVFGAFLGPFGTYNTMTFGMRLAFWCLTSLGLGLASVSAVYVLHKSFERLSIWILLMLASLITAWPGAFYISWLYPRLSEMASAQASLPALALEVCVIAFLALSLHFILTPLLHLAIEPEQPDLRPEPSAENEPKTEPRLSHIHPPIFNHLPQALREAQIISISMEDHYANIRTTMGEHLHLMRLSDAIADLGSISGTQIHRSHWVAEEFAHTLEKVGRKHEMTLTDGNRLPVSNTYLEAARELVD